MYGPFISVRSPFSLAELQIPHIYQTVSPLFHGMPRKSGDTKTPKYYTMNTITP